MPWDPFLMKNLLKIEVCGTYEQCTGVLFMGEQSKVVTTVHEQCMNNSRNYSSPTEMWLEKKKKKSKMQMQNSKRVSKPCISGNCW